jgi:hypothetical protein
MHSFSWIEKALLLVLLSASGALSGVRFHKVLDAIHRAPSPPALPNIAQIAARWLPPEAPEKEA